jgi:uncharacterized protein (DUF1015 family)
MVEVKSFKGIIYNRDKIGRLDDVMSPPYDIISSEMQMELYDKNPYNFVRLILGKQEPDDDNLNNRYSRAKKQFNSWIKESILNESKNKAIFPYKIEYYDNKQLKIMNGFFILLKLDPKYDKVKAHEKTLSKPKEDRLNLLSLCKVNFEPIQLLYIDEKDELRKKIDNELKEPIIDVKGYDGFVHKLWKLNDSNIHSLISEFFIGKNLFIADGHHRYQTAINFANEMRNKTRDFDDNAPFNYRLVVLVNMFDDGLSILPTHRLIKKPDIDIVYLIKKLNKYFTIEEKKVENKKYDLIVKNIKNDLITKKEHKFAMYIKGKYFILNLKDEKFMDDLSGSYSKTWRKLDVSILHKIVLENLMGINQENLEDHISYTRNDNDAINFVDNGNYDISFLMNSTKIEELRDIAEAGEHMPQKSTYFLPKMLSGLVMYKMEI